MKEYSGSQQSKNIPRSIYHKGIQLKEKVIN
jgi:hypothetical protein